jgi:hypothetical protein
MRSLWPMNHLFGNGRQPVSSSPAWITRRAYGWPNTAPYPVRVLNALFARRIGSRFRRRRRVTRGRRQARKNKRFLRHAPGAECRPEDAQPGLPTDHSTAASSSYLHHSPCQMSLVRALAIMFMLAPVAARRHRPRAPGRASRATRQRAADPPSIRWTPGTRRPARRAPYGRRHAHRSHNLCSSRRILTWMPSAHR